MTQRRTHYTHLLQQGVMILMGVLILYLGVGVIRQVSLSQQRKGELEKIKQDIAHAQEETQALQDELAYIQSPEAVEEFARMNNQPLPDEVAVIVSEGSPAADAVDQGVVEKDQRPGSPRAAWWEFFFGSR